MRASLTKEEWDKWKKEALVRVQEVLDMHDIVLDEVQNQLIGERYLMSGKKLVLQGSNKHSLGKVIVKYSDDKHLINEISDERRRKKIIENIKFGYKSIYFPKELVWTLNNKYALLITEYIDQETVFVKYPIKEQFFYSLKALEAFEGVHSVVSKHDNELKSLSSPKSSEDYIRSFAEMKEDTEKQIPERKHTLEVLDDGLDFLKANQSLVQKYCDFLTHDDFVPHNMRILENDVVVLDHSSLVVGNKYESWARFLNFMIIYGRDLDNMLSEYVLTNRGEEEYTTLRLMRIYKVGFLINFYAKAINKTTGPLFNITDNRVKMWTKVMECLIQNVEIPIDLISQHHEILKNNRSEEEKIRHKEISG